MPERKGKKVTIEDDTPTQKPSAPSKSPVVNAEPSRHASTGTASDPDVRGPGVQQSWQNTNRASGQAVNAAALNGHNPTFGQLPSVHQTGGFLPPTQQAAAPGAGCFYHNSNPLPHPGAYQLHQHNPYFISHPQANLLLIPTQHHYHLATMAGYGNGSMPNMGQHFQPPVPDTTYGPMVHTYRPRFDAGVQVAPGGGSAFVAQQPTPCTCPYPTTPAPAPCGIPMPQVFSLQVQTGMATAPVAMPIMSYQPPVMVQGGQNIQAMPAAMHSQGFPAVMHSPSMPQPVGGPMGGHVIAGNCAPNLLPQGMLYPDIMGVGRTQSENTIELLNSMHKNNTLEPQGFKPEDDDPSRMYCVRELDGNWTQRNRMTIDNLPCRWYITPHGAFYAVRLED
ncbi:hypothetical protein TruAng_007729 [Truncatella angustata]|nr:hypothetical protein TruAng_007729 [Truncatella angustata]